jgi:DNA-binding transcriptional MerR regulator
VYNDNKLPLLLILTSFFLNPNRIIVIYDVKWRALEVKGFYSVKEFAKLTGVETTTLRFWDAIGLFSPEKRDPENNYRYYSLPQITAVNFVSVLSDLKIPLKKISELRRGRNPKSFIKLLERKEKELDMELRAVRVCSSVIHARRELIDYGLRVEEEARISVLYREEKTIILWPRNEYKEGETFMEPLAAFVNKAKEYRINLNFPIGGYWDSLEAFQKAPTQPDRFFSIDPTGTQKRKEGRYLVGFVRGYYGQMGDLPDRMVACAKENRIPIYGPTYVIYLHDEICTQNSTEYLAQVCVAIDPKYA